MAAPISLRLRKFCSNASRTAAKAGSHVPSIGIDRSSIWRLPQEFPRHGFVGFAIGQTNIVDGGSSACLTLTRRWPSACYAKAHLRPAQERKRRSFSPLGPVGELAAGASDAKAVKRPLDFECNLGGSVIRSAYTGRIVSQHLRRTGQALADIVRTQHSVGVAADRQRGGSWALVCSNNIGTPRRDIAGMIRVFILRPPTPSCA